MYENIHVLNVHVNKFLWVHHKNILPRKFCQVEIVVHILVIKQLLATYTSLFAIETATIVLPIVIRDKYAHTKTISNW